MAEAVDLQEVDNSVSRTPKDKSCLLEEIGRYREACGVDGNQPVLVLAGGQEDLDILTACGFKQMVMSNIDSAGLALDAENIAIPDNSYPIVITHDALHPYR